MTDTNALADELEAARMFADRMVEIPDDLRARIVTALRTTDHRLKTVLDREAATTARYDAKLDTKDVEIARLREENASLRHVLAVDNGEQP